ncbi:MAG: D-alanyl-D-alanine carboxypeptidase/D-alanyl-D-alanine-endopeptidase [Ignavibacteriales bacterium]|nr:D-alanyl-D-alanine carboxypeptidase/D-alanyl-D-alanine-endopeptidase [Ignavibacteriales bacterium]
MSLQVRSQHDKTTGMLTRQINSLLADSSLIPCSIGISIMDIASGESIYALNADKLFHPASNMKLVTTAAAIHSLPSNFQFKTTLTSNGLLIDGILEGDLILTGFGDPLFSHKNLDSMVQFLKQSGIRKIYGKIKFDINYFDSLKWGHGWMWDDEPDPTAPFITPIIIDNNTVTFTMYPNTILNEKPFIRLTPESNYFQIINNSITSSDSSIPEVQIRREHGSNIIYFSGRIAPGVNPKEFRISISNPVEYLNHLFFDRLIKSGIEIKNMEANLPLKSYPIFELTHDLDSVINIANKLSDNLAAEVLLKTIAAELTTMPGSSENGIRLIKKFLIDEGIDTTSLFIADGSGASWYNALSPNFLVKLLCLEYKNKTSFSRYYESISIAGVDGTLKNRMKGTPAQNNVRAKTGTLTGCNGISGYIHTKDNVPLAFSILLNHCPVEQSNMRKIEDDILELIGDVRIK